MTFSYDIKQIRTAGNKIIIENENIEKFDSHKSEGQEIVVSKNINHNAGMGNQQGNVQYLIKKMWYW